MAFHLIFSRGWHSSVHSSSNHRIRARQSEKRVEVRDWRIHLLFDLPDCECRTFQFTQFADCRLSLPFPGPRTVSLGTLGTLRSPLSILEAQFYCPVTGAPSSIVAHKQAKLSPSDGTDDCNDPDEVLMRLGHRATGQFGKWLTKCKQANADAESQARRNEKRIRWRIGRIETG